MTVFYIIATLLVIAIIIQLSNKSSNGEENVNPDVKNNLAEKTLSPKKDVCISVLEKIYVDTSSFPQMFDVKINTKEEIKEKIFCVFSVALFEIVSEGKSIFKNATPYDPWGSKGYNIFLEEYGDERCVFLGGPYSKREFIKDEVWRKILIKIVGSDSIEEMSESIANKLSLAVSFGEHICSYDTGSILNKYNELFEENLELKNITENVNQTELNNSSTRWNKISFDVRKVIVDLFVEKINSRIKSLNEFLMEINEKNQYYKITTQDGFKINKSYINEVQKMDSKVEQYFLGLNGLSLIYNNAIIFIESNMYPNEEQKNLLVETFCSESKLKKEINSAIDKMCTYAGITEFNNRNIINPYQKN